MQRVHGRIGLEDYGSAVASVASVRAAERHILLSAEMNQPCAALAGGNIYLCFVKKIR
jgi:hypothetical protein